MSLRSVCVRALWGVCVGVSVWSHLGRLFGNLCKVSEGQHEDSEPRGVPREDSEGGFSVYNPHMAMRVSVCCPCRRSLGWSLDVFLAGFTAPYGD